MTKKLPRFLLGASAAILALGGLMHGRAFGKAAAAVASSNLPEFYGRSFKALWLIDSASLVLLAAVFGLAAARPASASGRTLLLLALIPAATAALQYAFLGMFIPAHGLAAAAVMAAIASLSLRSG